MIPEAGPWFCSTDLTGFGHVSLCYMDEHHGEVTKTSVLWKKLNSVHPGYLASIQRFLEIPVELDLRETIHLPQDLEACDAHLF